MHYKKSEKIHSEKTDEVIILVDKFKLNSSGTDEFNQQTLKFVGCRPRQTDKFMGGRHRCADGVGAQMLWTANFLG
jgi:hypothetical protein